MTLTDEQGFNWSYLATEDNFQFIQTMQRKNLIIPLVGDFAGPKTIRGVGQYLKEHGSAVTVFYTSNVEYYIQSPSNVWTSYCRNVASLPIEPSSLFIRFDPYGYASGPPSTIAPMSDFVKLVAQNRIPGYVSVLRMSR